MCCSICMQGPAATHLHLLEALLQRCVAQAATHRLPSFFANGVLALAEHATLHQPQPSGAPTAADVAALATSGETRLTFCPSESKGEKRGALTAAPTDNESQNTTVAVRRASPACVVRNTLCCVVLCIHCAWCQRGTRWCTLFAKTVQTVCWHYVSHAASFMLSVQ
jgi:hypothetical protein